jgi:hypothetical protein
MTPEPTPNERARRLRAERRSRITAIRKRVAVVSLTAFIALFSTIYIQMAAGHDPTLGQKSKSATTQTKAKAKAKSKASSGSTPSSTVTPTPAPVTTGQS